MNEKQPENDDDQNYKRLKKLRKIIQNHRKATLELGLWSKLGA